MLKQKILKREITSGQIIWCAMLDVTSLTSHEEKQASNIVHEALIPAAAQQSYCPAKQDDGQSHAHEGRCHSAQIWRTSSTSDVHQRLPAICISDLGYNLKDISPLIHNG